jgi:hypothetical protein
MNGRTETKATISPLFPRGRLVIYGNGCGQSWYVCERARCVREPRLRAAWPLRARQLRGDARPDDDDGRQRGGERPRDDDAHAPDVSVTVPSAVPPFLHDIEPWCSN